jgi:hypothetical protein
MWLSRGNESFQDTETGKSGQKLLAQPIVKVGILR